MNTLMEKIADLNDLILQGKMMQALDVFYDDEIVTQTNDERPVAGKEANRQRLDALQNSISEFRCARPMKVAVGEQTTMVEWYFDLETKDKGNVRFTQVAVQDWKEGRIVKEKYYRGT